MSNIFTERKRDTKKGGEIGRGRGSQREVDETTGPGKGTTEKDDRQSRRARTAPTNRTSKGPIRGKEVRF